jgi:signal transduction histidine kinase
MGGLIVWTAAQSIYGNLIAAMLYFAPYVPGETLATFFLCGALTNAAATLRSSVPLSFAGAGATVCFMLGLPLAQFIIGGAENSLELMPLVGALLLLGFGINLWKSLVASDVAQIQAQEAVMRERQAAAAAAAAKTNVIRRMNDEMRTPMQALIGAAEHLRRAASSPQARAHIATLVHAGEVLKLVLDDVSDLDRLENGLVRIQTKPANPRDLVRGVVSAFRAAAEDKHLELFLDVGPGIPEHAVIDALRVRQVLFNLLANAVRYTTTGGVRVRLSAQAAGEGRARLLFQVADTGPGMSQAQLASIFGRARVCADGEGPGLGLSISLRLARLMGGHLSARSEVGGGSVFSFSLEAPVRASAPQEARQLAR